MKEGKTIILSGPTLNQSTDDHCVIFVGLLKILKDCKYEKWMGELTKGKVTDCVWNEGMEGLNENGGTISLHLNRHILISLPDSHSRCTSPSNSHLLVNQLHAVKANFPSKNLSFVILCEYSHCVSLVSSISRVFPLFSRQSTFIPHNLVVQVVCTDMKDLPPLDISLLNHLSSSIRMTARLSDMPANQLTTDNYVEEILTIGKILGVESKVIRGEELREEGFGGIYHVGKAGPTPPAFVLLSYKPKGAKETFALVGKGIVYDTGGMHLKSTTQMLGMKRDMAGSAALLGSFYTLVKANFIHNLHLCMCIAENNISPIANKPDDIITLLSGKTVEITNTDAEGRLVLADGVFYAKETLKASFILNMATLTGGQVFMTGKTHAAVMCSKEETERKSILAGLHSGDLVHPMIYAPDQHCVDLRSPVADMDNCKWGEKDGPSSVVAAMFVGAHIDYGKEVDWVHVDMLAPSARDGRSTAWGVSFTICLLGKYTNSPLLHKLSQ